MAKVDYFIKFDSDGNRGETHDAAFMSETDITKYKEQGFIEVSTADYMNLLGNNADNQPYIRKDDGTFIPKPPYVPTSQELNQANAATAKSEIQNMANSLALCLLTDAPITGIKEQYTAKVASLSDDVSLLMTEYYPVWSGYGEEYKKDYRLTYNGVLYKVLQDHISQENWTPDAAPSLFTKVLTSTDGQPSQWIQPDSTNPYMMGDKVIYNGHCYQSTIDNNVWAPDAYPEGWKLVE